MVLYAVTMFITAVLFGGISLTIYRGKTDLIHSYHQTNVTDKAAYGKAFGKAMFVVTAALFLSGVVSLFGKSAIVAMIAVGVLIVGLLVGIVCIVAVQIKHNGGLF